MIQFLLSLENSDNDGSHQLDKRLLLLLIELTVYRMIFIVLKVEAVLIHRRAPKHRISALKQSNWRGLNQQFPAESAMGYRCQGQPEARQPQVVASTVAVLRFCLVTTLR
jgi:hypothetical protein